MSLLHTALGIIDTGRISVPTVIDSALGRLSTEVCDRRLHWWAHKLLADAQVDLVVGNLAWGCWGRLHLLLHFFLLKSSVCPQGVRPVAVDAKFLPDTS